MSAGRAILAVILMMGTASAARAQEGIDPDRPDVTNGTHIVETGLLQLEMGALYTHVALAQGAFGSPVTARVGLTEWLEARIGTDGFLTQTDGNARASGVGNTQLGAKLRLWSNPGGVPVLSILPAVNLPTADAGKGLGTGKTDFTVALLTGTDIGRRAHVDINYGAGAIGSPNDRPRFLQHLVSASTSAAVTDNWNPYVEVFWFSRQDARGSSLTSIDGGAIYQIGTRYAVDGGAQFGITANAPRFAVFGGLSLIVGDVLGSHGPEERARRARLRAGAPRR